MTDTISTWAKRSALIECIELGDLTISDPKGIIDFLKNHTTDIEHVFENTCNATDGEATAFLLSEYRQSELVDGNYIQEDFSNHRNTYFLQEEGEVDSAPAPAPAATSSPATQSSIVQNMVTIGVASTAALLIQHAITHPEERPVMRKSLKDLAVVPAEGLDTIAKNAPFVRRKFNDTETFTKFVRKHAAILLNRIQNLDRTIAVRAKERGMSVADYKNKVVKRKNTIKAISKGTRKTPGWVKATGRGGAVVLGITAASGLAFAAYQKWFEKSAKACKDKKGKERTACRLKYKIQACDAAMHEYKTKFKADSPEDREKLNAHVWRFSRRKQKYQEKLQNLDKQKANVFKDHMGYV